MFAPPLNAVQQRVLGCLLEKGLSTPDYYPLTLNALVAACNQSTNRDPVLSLDDSAVMESLLELRERQWIWFVDAAGSRVQKYEHRLDTAFGLSVQESAILAELLLRGPQTPGELRSRCTRMYPFPDLQEVESALQLLLESTPPLVHRLQRQPGTKEARFSHLLGEAGPAPTAAPPQEHATGLASEVALLREELAQLRAAFEAFRKQFE